MKKTIKGSIIAFIFIITISIIITAIVWWQSHSGEREGQKDFCNNLKSQIDANRPLFEDGELNKKDEIKFNVSSETYNKECLK
jgi:hypothetical protein